MDTSKIKYTECYVAFIDILGFKELVKHSKEDADCLQKLLITLNEIADTSSSGHCKRSIEDKTETIWLLQVRFFSDSLALFIPTEADGHISWILSKIGHLYDRMLEQECCLRGAITIGNMLWNNDWSSNGISPNKKDLNLPVSIVQGLIDAYNLEQDSTIYPRILISEKLWQHIEDKAIKASPISSMCADASELLVKDFIKQDFDGLFYFDIFSEKRDNDT